MRIAVADPLKETAAAGLARAGAGQGAGTIQLVAAAIPKEDRQRQRWQRIWQERRRGRGANLSDAEAALADVGVRALLLALDRGAETVLLPEGSAAWGLLEPAAGHLACADLWIGVNVAGEPMLGWMDWPGTDSLSAAAEQLRSAAATQAAVTGQATTVMLLNFAGGRNPWQAGLQRLATTLAARLPLQRVELYSPLFFEEGRLKFGTWLEQVRKAVAKDAIPLVCVPQLGRAEIAEGLTSVGGVLAGPVRAGAEMPAAGLPAQASAARAAATLAMVARWAGAAALA